MKSRSFCTVIAFIVTLLLLLVGNFAFSRWTLPYRDDSRLGKVVRHLWHHTKVKTDTAGNEIRTVLFLGSSVFDSCILPEVFERQSAGQNLRFINTARSSMYHWHYSKILPLVDLKALRTKICVIEIAPWTFNKNTQELDSEKIWLPSELDSWGNLDEVWVVSSWKRKCRFLAKMAVPKLSLRDYLLIAKNVCKGGPGVPELRGPLYHHDQAKAESQRKNHLFFAQNISKRHLANYEFSDFKRDQFMQLVKSLENQGIEIVFVQPPVKKNYFNHIQNNPRLANEFRKHFQFLDELATQYKTLVWPTREDAGLQDSHFVDYGHFTFNGAKKFSAMLTDAMHGMLTTASEKSSQRQPEQMADVRQGAANRSGL
ncbi:MAG: hypothetical protein VX970_09650 [Planctomycetota bacterium]|nr:hypothetical protein [Planctomycetota bacterium]